MGHSQRPFSSPTAAATAALLASLAALNGLAIVSLLAAREGARRVALEDLKLQTQVHAHALEAVLATLRADLTFLAQAPPLSRAPEIHDSADPVVRRWRRLDLEGTLLLFLEAHPAIERLWLRGPDELLAAAGRRQGSPVLLRPDEIAASPAADLLHGSFAVAAAPGPWQVEAWADPERLVGMAAPGLSGRLELDRAAGPPVAREGWVAVAAAVAEDAWQGPLSWRLVRREPADRLIQSFESLASRYRLTVLLNVGVLGLATLLGVLALRQARRTARLEAEARHREERLELERQLRHGERLASVGRLAAGIAHEINNPLEGMANYLALLDEDLRRGETRDLAHLVARLREGLERAAGAVRQVLAFADPGRAPQAPLDLRRVVERTLGFVRANPEFRGVALAPLGGEEQAVMVSGNPTTLGQLVLNLLINACQAQPDGGRVEARLERQGENARLTIDDWGPGIAPAALPHLFEPFFSTRGSTGLGLAVCHGIVGEHGGTLTAANRAAPGAPGAPGAVNGARFVVTLPLAAAPVAAEPAGAPA